MAKQVGPFFISGTIQGISFYKSGDQHLVRKAGGPSKKQIQTSPNFERTRYNLSEFAACSANGAFIRGFMARSFKFNDSCMYRRFTQLLTQIKNYDTVSPYGTRCIGKALQNKAAKQLFCSFNFNKAAFQQVVHMLPTINHQQQICFAPNSMVLPRGANKVIITASQIQFDFTNKQATGYEYMALTLNKNNYTHQQYIKPLTINTTKKEMAFYFLQLRFFCNELPFANGNNDVVACIAIDPPLAKADKLPLVSACALPFAMTRQPLSTTRYIKRFKTHSQSPKVLRDDSS